MPPEASLREIGERNPEWRPWLAVLAELGGALDAPDWRAFVPCPAVQDERTPLLAGARLDVEPQALARLWDTLTRAAAHGGAPGFSGLRGVSFPAGRVMAFFSAALEGDERALERAAGDAQIPAEPLRALAGLLPIPFLHACARAWDSEVSAGWRQGYCPVCGAWPALAEICGVERSRFLRCGRCGSAWQALHLSCPYCGTLDHNDLASLVTEDGGSKSSIEACRRCHGYVKSFARLRCTAPRQVMLDDLASVELDLAAAERGYRRPLGAGHALRITVSPRAAPAANAPQL
jgi:FdhE protein